MHSKIAIMTVSDGFGASGREELLRLAAGNGITIVTDERHGPQDTDLSAQMTKNALLAAPGHSKLVNRADTDFGCQDLVGSGHGFHTHYSGAMVLET